MINKKIANIIYTYYDEETNTQDGIVFFADGTHIEVDRDKVIDYIIEYAKQENITSKKALFKNKHIISMNTSKINDSIISNYDRESKEEKQDVVVDDMDPEVLSKKIEEETARQIKEEGKLNNNSEEELSEEELNKILEEDNDEDLSKVDSELDEDESKSLWNIIKKTSKKAKIIITAVGIAAIVGITSAFGGCSLNKKAKTGTMNPTTTTNNDENNKTYTQSEFEKLSFSKLVESTKNTTQKNTMSKIGCFLDNYNGTFAGKNIETNKNVKAALTWDESIALNLAYNDYSQDEIRSIFNNSSVDATTLTNAYKSANLQLASAYVIESNTGTINLDNIINSESGKSFYTKYHDLFMKCKTTSGTEQINNVNEFYKNLASDFSIIVDDREVGMSHSESMNNLESYKLSVVPMVTAAEMMFQNLEIDNTLSDEVLAYFNDIGLCNYANDKYSKDEAIMLTATKDESNPYYETFKTKKIEELTSKNQYNVKDLERDLSDLASFKSAVNVDVKIVMSSDVSTSSTNVYGSYTSSSQETTYRIESDSYTTSDRNEAVSSVGEEAVSDAEAKVNTEINIQNEAAKTQAEKEAEEKRKQQQAEEDKKKQELEDAAKKENDNLQNKIDDANNTISSDGTVNEKDFGQTDDGYNKVDIDDEHSNENGDIYDSVKDITTDGTGAVLPSEPLPTPTDDGAVNGYKDETTITPSSNQSNTIIEEEIELSNEELADLMVQAMSSEAYFDNDNSYTYKYTK